MDRAIQSKIEEALNGLFTAVSMLQEAYPGKPFTLMDAWSETSGRSWRVWRTA